MQVPGIKGSITYNTNLEKIKRELNNLTKKQIYALNFKLPNLKFNVDKTNIEEQLKLLKIPTLKFNVEANCKTNCCDKATTKAVQKKDETSQTIPSGLFDTRINESNVFGKQISNLTGMFRDLSMVLDNELVRSAINLEVAFSTMSAVTGKSKVETQLLTEEFLMMSTVLSGTIEEITEASVILLKSGVAFEEVAESTEIVMKLSKLTGDTFKESAETLVTYKTVFKDAFDQGTLSLEGLGNKLAYITNATKMSMEDVKVFSNYALSAGKSINMTVDSLGAMAVGFSKVGLQASTIGTQIRKFADIWNKDTIGTRKFFQQIGVNQQAFLQQMASGSNASKKALTDLAVKLRSFSDEDVGIATSKLEILERNMIKVFRTSADEFIKAQTDISSNVDGEIDKSIKIAQTVKGAWEGLKSTFVDITFEPILESLTFVFDKLNASFSSVREVLGDVESETKSLISSLTIDLRKAQENLDKAQFTGDTKNIERYKDEVDNLTKSIENASDKLKSFSSINLFSESLELPNMANLQFEKLLDDMNFGEDDIARQVTDTMQNVVNSVFPALGQILKEGDQIITDYIKESSSEELAESIGDKLKNMIKSTTQETSLTLAKELKDISNFAVEGFEITDTHREMVALQMVRLFDMNIDNETITKNSSFFIDTLIEKMQFAIEGKNTVLFDALVNSIAGNKDMLNAFKENGYNIGEQLVTSITRSIEQDGKFKLSEAVYKMLGNSSETLGTFTNELELYFDKIFESGEVTEEIGYAYVNFQEQIMGISTSYQDTTNSLNELISSSSQYAGLIKAIKAAEEESITVSEARLQLINTLMSDTQRNFKTIKEQVSVDIIRDIQNNMEAYRTTATKSGESTKGINVALEEANALSIEFAKNMKEATTSTQAGLSYESFKTDLQNLKKNMDVVLEDYDEKTIQSAKTTIDKIIAVAQEKQKSFQEATQTEATFNTQLKAFQKATKQAFNDLRNEAKNIDLIDDELEKERIKAITKEISDTSVRFQKVNVFKMDFSELTAYLRRVNEAVNKTKELIDLGSVDPLKTKGMTSNLPIGRGFAEGGYTGNYGVNEIAGIVHGQEYVVNAPTLKSIGGVDGLENLLGYKQLTEFNSSNNQANFNSVTMPVRNIDIRDFVKNNQSLNKLIKKRLELEQSIQNNKERVNDLLDNQNKNNKELIEQFDLQLLQQKKIKDLKFLSHAISLKDKKVVEVVSKDSKKDDKDKKRRQENLNRLLDNYQTLNLRNNQQFIQLANNEYNLKLKQLNELKDVDLKKYQLAKKYLNENHETALKNAEELRREYERTENIKRYGVDAQSFGSQSVMSVFNAFSKGESVTGSIKDAFKGLANNIGEVATDRLNNGLKGVFSSFNDKGGFSLDSLKGSFKLEAGDFNPNQLSSMSPTQLMQGIGSVVGGYMAGEKYDKNSYARETGAVGSAIGTIFGPVGSKIGGELGALIGSGFGKKWTEYRQGIEFKTGGFLQDIFDEDIELMAVSYQKKKKFFKSKYKESYRELDNAEFNAVVNSIQYYDNLFKQLEGYENELYITASKTKETSSLNLTKKLTDDLLLNFLGVQQNIDKTFQVPTGLAGRFGVATYVQETIDNFSKDVLEDIKKGFEHKAVNEKGVVDKDELSKVVTEYLSNLSQSKSELLNEINSVTGLITFESLALENNVKTNIQAFSNELSRKKEKTQSEIDDLRSQIDKLNLTTDYGLEKQAQLQNEINYLESLNFSFENLNDIPNMLPLDALQTLQENYDAIKTTLTPEQIERYEELTNSLISFNDLAIQQADYVMSSIQQSGLNYDDMLKMTKREMYDSGVSLDVIDEVDSVKKDIYSVLSISTDNIIETMIDFYPQNQKRIQDAYLYFEKQVVDNGLTIQDSVARTKSSFSDIDEDLIDFFHKVKNDFSSLRSVLSSISLGSIDLSMDELVNKTAEQLKDLGLSLQQINAIKNASLDDLATILDNSKYTLEDIEAISGSQSGSVREAYNAYETMMLSGEYISVDKALTEIGDDFSGLSNTLINLFKNVSYNEKEEVEEVSNTYYRNPTTGRLSGNGVDLGYNYYTSDTSGFGIQNIKVDSPTYSTPTTFGGGDVRFSHTGVTPKELENFNYKNRQAINSIMVANNSFVRDVVVEISSSGLFSKKLIEEMEGIQTLSNSYFKVHAGTLQSINQDWMDYFKNIVDSSSDLNKSLYDIYLQMDLVEIDFDVIKGSIVDESKKGIVNYASLMSELSSQYSMTTAENMQSIQDMVFQEASNNLMNYELDTSSQEKFRKSVKDFLLTTGADGNLISNLFTDENGNFLFDPAKIIEDELGNISYDTLDVETGEAFTEFASSKFGSIEELQAFFNNISFFWSSFKEESEEAVDWVADFVSQQRELEFTDFERTISSYRDNFNELAFSFNELQAELPGDVNNPRSSLSLDFLKDYKENLLTILETHTTLDNTTKELFRKQIDNSNFLIDFYNESDLLLKTTLHEINKYGKEGLDAIDFDRAFVFKAIGEKTDLLSNIDVFNNNALETFLSAQESLDVGSRISNDVISMVKQLIDLNNTYNETSDENLNELNLDLNDYRENLFGKKSLEEVFNDNLNQLTSDINDKLGTEYGSSKVFDLIQTDEEFFKTLDSNSRKLANTLLSSSNNILDEVEKFQDKLGVLDENKLEDSLSLLESFTEFDIVNQEDIDKTKDVLNELAESGKLTTNEMDTLVDAFDIASKGILDSTSEITAGVQSDMNIYQNLISQYENLENDLLDSRLEGMSPLEVANEFIKREKDLKAEVVGLESIYQSDKSDANLKNYLDKLTDYQSTFSQSQDALSDIGFNLDSDFLSERLDDLKEPIESMKETVKSMTADTIDTNYMYVGNLVFDKDTGNSIAVLDNGNIVIDDNTYQAYETGGDIKVMDNTIENPYSQSKMQTAQQDMASAFTNAIENFKASVENIVIQNKKDDIATDKVFDIYLDGLKVGNMVGRATNLSS